MNKKKSLAERFFEMIEEKTLVNIGMVDGVIIREFLDKEEANERRSD